MSAEPIEVTEATSETAPDVDSGAANGAAVAPILGFDNGEISRVSGLEARRRVAELQAIAARANDLRDRRKAANTTRAHASDWRQFTGWCTRLGLPSLPTTAEVLALYVADHADRHVPRTISRRLSSISVIHREAGYDPPPTRDQLVTEVMAGLYRTVEATPDQKAAMRVQELRRMLAAMDLSRLVDVRDRSILLLAFACAFRRSTVAGVDVGHVTEEAEGLIVRVPRSKTNQQGPAEEFAVLWGEHELTCPVRAWRDWLRASGIDDGPAYRPIDRWGNLGASRLSGAAVAQVVKRRAAAVGYDPDRFGGHSPRRGLVTTAADRDVAEADIQATTGHRSVAVLRGYIDRVNLFKRSASGKVGL